MAGQVLRVVQPSEATVAMGTPIMEQGNLGRLEAARLNAHVRRGAFRLNRR